jgi:hypothetical protein
MKKEIVLALAAPALIVVSFASCDESPRPVYVDGPNAGSEECRKIAQGWDGMVERHSDEDTQAEKRATTDSDGVMRSSLTDAQKQIALNNLSAKEEAEKAGREARQSNEIISLRERERVAGCQIENPKH